MSIKSYFGTVAETQELHSVVDLRSRYYKTSYKNAKAAVSAFIVNTHYNNIEHHKDESKQIKYKDFVGNIVDY